MFSIVPTDLPVISALDTSVSGSCIRNGKSVVGWASGYTCLIPRVPSEHTSKFSVHYLLYLAAVFELRGVCCGFSIPDPASQFPDLPPGTCDI